MFFESRIYRIKQYLDYIKIWILQNFLAILTTFVNLNSFMKNFTSRRQLPKLLLLIFLANLPTGRKYLKRNLTFVRGKYLFLKSKNIKNFQTNNKSLGNNGFTAELYMKFSNELATPTQTVVYKSNIYYSEIYQKDIWRKKHACLLEWIKKYNFLGN